MSVGGLLLALGLELDVAADRLDDDVLGAEVGHVHQDLVRVVVVLDPRDAVAAIGKKVGSNSIGWGTSSTRNTTRSWSLPGRSCPEAASRSMSIDRMT